MAFPAAAGEIYGRVSDHGRVVGAATVSVECDSYADKTTTDRNGVYRVSGPRGEEKCSISVGDSQGVTIYTSKGRTRVNLEIVGPRIIRR